MNIRQVVAGLVIALVSIFFGINPDSLNGIADWIDPPPAGFARVEQVVDGDTIVVRFGEVQERVRFIGVDTPETNHPDKAVQCYGKAATEFLKSRIENSDVRLEMDPTNTNRDRYDRLLRYVYDEDDNLLNQQIIEEGYGFAYTAFPFQKMDQFVAAQTSAENNSKGLWSQCEVEEDGDFFNSGPDLGVR